MGYLLLVDRDGILGQVMNYIRKRWDLSGVYNYLNRFFLCWLLNWFKIIKFIFFSDENLLFILQLLKSITSLKVCNIKSETKLYPACQPVEFSNKYMISRVIWNLTQGSLWYNRFTCSKCIVVLPWTFPYTFCTVN